MLFIHEKTVLFSVHMLSRKFNSVQMEITDACLFLCVPSVMLKLEDFLSFRHKNREGGGFKIS